MPVHGFSCMGFVRRVTENMDPPALSRTTSPVWGDMPSYLGNAEQLHEYLTDELNK